MKPLRNRANCDDPPERRVRARRKARAFEAFMSEQALALHRTVTATGRAVMAPHPGRTPDLAGRRG
jgi:hypothetical protein